MKRVIFLETQGPRKGLHHILGADTFEGGKVPETATGFVVRAREIEFASLVKVTPRAVWYREAFPRPTGRFGQTMDSFHPEQR